MPILDRHGVVQTDYFMLIVAPNVFSRAAFESGKKHMMLVGTHGLVSLAIKDLLDNDHILEWIFEHPRSRDNSGYYQAIF